MANPLTPPPHPHSPGPSARAVATLILGVAALIPTCLFVTGIPAIILGRAEIRAIEARKAPAAGAAMAGVGRTLGGIGTTFGILLILAWVALVALGYIVDGL